MQIHIKVTVTDNDDAELAKQIEQTMMRRIVKCDEGKAVGDSFPVALDADTGEIVEVKPAPATTPPDHGEHKELLGELNSLLAAIINLPSERKLREMRDLVDYAIAGLARKAKPSDKLRMGWHNDCLYYTDDRLAAAYIRPPAGSWFGVVIGPHDYVPDLVHPLHADVDIARATLLSRLRDIGVIFAAPPAAPGVPG